MAGIFLFPVGEVSAEGVLLTVRTEAAQVFERDSAVGNRVGIARLAALRARLVHVDHRDLSVEAILTARGFVALCQLRVERTGRAVNALARLCAEHAPFGLLDNLRGDLAAGGEAHGAGVD